MIDYEIIREMPLNELLRYYQALKAICEKHEADLRPLFKLVKNIYYENSIS